MRLESVLVAISAAASALAAMLFDYDAKRALWPRIPGEPWRQARVMGTATAVVRCSIPLKRLVASRLIQPRDS